MRSTTKALLRLGVGASFLAANALAQTESSRSIISFTYTSPAECPQRSEFVARVDARQSVRSAAEVDYALNEMLSRVVIEPSRTLGYVYFRDSRLEARKVTAGTCDEVVTGLALIAGVSLDVPVRPPEVVGADGTERNRVPEAPSGVGGKVANEPAVPSQTPTASNGGAVAERAPSNPASPVDARPDGVVPQAETRRAAAQGATSPTVVAPTSAAPSARGSTTSTSTGPKPNGSSTPRAGEAAPRDRALSQASDDARQPASTTVRALSDVTEQDDGSTDTSRNIGADTMTVAQVSELAVGVGAYAGLWTAFARPELRVAGFFEVGDRHNTWAARAYGFAALGDEAVSSWSATWRTYGGRLEGCPLFGGTGWHLAVCALGGLGAVVVQGASSVGNVSRDASVLWADVGVGVRVGSPKLWKVNWEAQLDAVVPITRYELVFEQPTVTVARVPNVAAVLSLGVRVDL